MAAKTNRPVTIEVTLDRVEEGIAALLVGEDDPIFEWHLPAEWLPKGMKEGDRMTCAFTLNPKATEDAKKVTASLMDELLKRSQQS